jgi:hypothetical protein
MEAERLGPWNRPDMPRTVRSILPTRPLYLAPTTTARHLLLLKCGLGHGPDRLHAARPRQVLLASDRRSRGGESACFQVLRTMATCPLQPMQPMQPGAHPVGPAPYSLSQELRAHQDSGRAPPRRAASLGHTPMRRCCLAQRPPSADHLPRADRQPSMSVRPGRATSRPGLEHLDSTPGARRCIGQLLNEAFHEGLKADDPTVDVDPRPNGSPTMASGPTVEAAACARLTATESARVALHVQALTFIQRC